MDQPHNHSNLDWIFANGPEVLRNEYNASIVALARCFGLTNLWGNRTSGTTYTANVLLTLSLAQPFLMSGDKDGYLAYCQRHSAALEQKKIDINNPR